MNRNLPQNVKYNSEEYIGQKFNQLTVLGIRHFTDAKGYNRYLWKCRCDCGKITEKRAEYVVRGHTKTCGHAKNEIKTNLKHGESKTRLHLIWQKMLLRCDPKKARGACWERYAGRGISVCEDWKDYLAFARWARSHGYSDELSIERINNDGDYCPENCVWADDKAQARNRCTTKYVLYDGKMVSLAEACELAGLPYKEVHARINRLGWNADEALSTPVGKPGRGPGSTRENRGT